MEVGTWEGGKDRNIKWDSDGYYDKKINYVRLKERGRKKKKKALKNIWNERILLMNVLKMKNLMQSSYILWTISHFQLKNPNFNLLLLILVFPNTCEWDKMDA